MNLLGFFLYHISAKSINMHVPFPLSRIMMSALSPSALSSSCHQAFRYNCVSALSLFLLLPINLYVINLRVFLFLYNNSKSTSLRSAETLATADSFSVDTTRVPPPLYFSHVEVFCDPTQEFHPGSCGPEFVLGDYFRSFSKGR